MSPRPPLRIRTLGVPRVELRGEPLDVQGKSLALLAYLAVEGETPREVLADLLWTDQAGDAARRNLRVQLHRLRASPAGPYLLGDGPGVRLAADVQVDLLEFRQAAAGERVQDAAALAEGPFLDHLTLTGAEAFDTWRESTAQAVRDEQWRALDASASAHVNRGEYGAALAVREQALRLDQLRERSVRAVMDVLLMTGQYDAALDAYDTLARRLKAELGVGAPLPATQALRAQVEQARAAGVQPGAGVLPPPVDGTTAPTVPLVGRDGAREALRSARLMLVLGEAGVGKSRLVLDTAGPRALVVRGAPELTPLPFGALLEVLRADALAHFPERLRPLLSDALNAPGGAALADRAALLDALAQALVSLLEARTLIVEDLHWLDAGSLEAVFLALHRTAPRVWLTARDSELGNRADLHEVLGRVPLPTLSLTELSEEDVAVLIEQLSGASAPLFTRRLHAATAGHPLFLVETLRGLRESGQLTVQDGRWHTPYDDTTVDYAEVPVPRSVTAAIADRVQRLGRDTRLLLQAAALWGEAFPTALVAAACDTAERAALDALERAELARLIVAEGSSYRFGHDLYRRAVAGTLSGPRARYLHGQLARLAPPGTPAGKIAEHHLLAGEPALAWPQWCAAAQDAERLYAHSDALALYARALACSPPDTDAFRIHAARSELYRHTDDRAGRTQALAAMQDIAARLGDTPLRADHAARQAKFHTEFDEYPAAVDVARAALDALGEQLSPDERATLLLEQGAALACLERWNEALDALSPALALTRGRHPARQANILYWVGHVHLEAGNVAAAASTYEDALSVLSPLPTRGRVLTLWKRAVALRRLGRYPESTATLLDAEACATTLNAGSILGMVLAEQAGLRLDAGDRAAAITLIDRARAVTGDDLEAQAHLQAVTDQLSEVPFEA